PVGHPTASAPAQSTSKTTDTTTAPVQQDLGLITVEATPRQAEQLAHAMNSGGTITLTLNPPDFDVKDFKTPTEIVEAYNLFDQDLTYLHEVQHQVAAANSGK